MAYFQSWYRTTLASLFDVGVTTMKVWTAPTSTSWRLYLKKSINGTLLEEWVSYSWVSGTTLTITGRQLSKTASPSTSWWSWYRWLAGDEVVWVIMHDQLIDSQWVAEFDGQLIVPQYTTTQRDALGAVANGNIIYNTTDGAFQVREWWAWNGVGAGASTPNASDTVAGKVELATDAEVIAQTTTGGSGATLVPTNNQFRRMTTSTLYTGVAGENLTAGNVVCVDQFSYTPYRTLSNAADIPDDFGSTSAKQRVSCRFSIPGSGTVSIGSIQINGLKQQTGTATATNITVQIETDSAGSPSWSLVNANATGTIPVSSITTSFQDIAMNFTGSFNLTLGTTYHIVMYHNGTFVAANDFRWNSQTTASSYLTTNWQRRAYNGTTWSAGSDYAGKFSLRSSTLGKILKTDATKYWLTNILWFATQTVSASANVQINTAWVDQNQTGLTPGIFYYLSNTAGALSTTPGTNITPVGVALSSTEIEFDKNANIPTDVLAGQSITASSSISSYENNTNRPIYFYLTSAGPWTFSYVRSNYGLQRQDSSVIIQPGDSVILTGVTSNYKAYTI